jgi:hypothetical protein
MNIMVNAQQWLDKNYPLNGVCRIEDENDGNEGKKREEIETLDISDISLIGSLELKGFTNLEVLYCDNNEISSLKIVGAAKLETLICFRNFIEELDIDNCSNLKKLSCQNNLLNELNLSQNQTLEHLDISSNLFKNKDLSFISHLQHLKELWIENNFFIGSLEPLKGLTKLKKLNISDTDLDSGLEHLPDGLEIFGCSSTYEAKVKEIEQKLRKFGDPKTWGLSGEKDLGLIENFSTPLNQWRRELVVNKKLREIAEEIAVASVKLKELEDKISIGLGITILLFLISLVLIIFLTRKTSKRNN